MSNDEKKSKIVTDESWKAQARAEKERLSEEEKKKSPPPSGAAEQKAAGPKSTGPLPPANFMTLVNSLVVQILFSLGRIGDPNAKESPPVNLDLAKHHIDMLQVLEDKTQGNLTDEEKKALALALHEVRLQYVQAAQT